MQMIGPPTPTQAEWATLMEWFSWTLGRLVFGYVNGDRMQQRWQLVPVTFTPEKRGVPSSVRRIRAMTP
jgi:hypothetical protein